MNYILNCVDCGKSYLSCEAFPDQQRCPSCADIYRAGMREVVEWLKDNNACPDHILDEWKAFLKEKGIEEVT